MRLRKIAMLVSVTLATLVIAQNRATAQSGGNTETSTDSIKNFSKDEVTASFAKGGTLVTASNYKVMTAHRTESGNVEIHRSYTDVFYIVQGSTNIVTGGKVIGQKDTNPEEPRGDSIEGGQSRHLSAGDVMVIPPGVPHWMKDVEGTLLYFVVKVKKPEA